MNSSESTTKSLPPRIAIVGAHTILGDLLIDALEDGTEVHEFWVFDLHTPKKRKYSKLRFIPIDLTEPGADATLANRFKSLEINTVVHAALKNNPSHRPSEAHELEVIGTMAIASAAKSAEVSRFVLCSTTMVYGASPKNPNYIPETAPLASHPSAHFVRDKIEADRQVQNLFVEAPQINVTILRFCLVVGPRSDNYFTQLLRRPVVPTLLGYDPLIQFIHEDDALEALRIATFSDTRGIFNIVGSGVIPLSYALREAGKARIPFATNLAYPLVQLLWNFELSAVPGKLLDYFRYLWVADGEKARELMHFHPRYSSKEAFLEFAKTSRLQEYAWAK